MPSSQTLAFTEPLQSAAPRQQLTLTATGGAGGYRFAFAPGGNLSGDDATVDPTTGVYRAGARGSAQDLVEVTDAAGARATARITVGPRLAVTPALAPAAPGGRIRLVASGGWPDYVFSFGANPSGGQIDQDGWYTAGPTGNVEDTVLVTDRTGDAAAFAKAVISVGTELRLYTTATTVAPFESATVVAFGGQAPYTLGLAAAPSSDAGGDPSLAATIDSTSGLYTAGANGNVDDVVEARDANGQTARRAIHVGPGLALALEGTPPDPRPGVPLQLVASGGKRPYAYAFAPRGNRSGGRVDGTTGAYVPGFASGATDVLQVTDQTGRAVARASNPTPVGARRIQVGAMNRVCAAADLNGDGAGDLVVGNDGFTKMGAVLLLATDAPVLDAYTISFGDGAISFVAEEDLDDDGRDDIVLASRYLGVRVLVPDWVGQLEMGAFVPATPTFHPEYVIHQREQGDGHRFYTDSFDWTGAICGGPTGLVHLLYDGGSSPPRFIPRCVPAPRWSNTGGVVARRQATSTATGTWTSRRSGRRGPERRTGTSTSRGAPGPRGWSWGSIRSSCGA